MKSKKIILLSIVLVSTVCSCRIGHPIKTNILNDIQMPESMEFCVDDSCYNARLADWHTESYKIKRYIHTHNTYYADVEGINHSYLVIPLKYKPMKLEDKIKITSDSGCSHRIFFLPAKRFDAKKGDTLTLKLIPIFPEDRMPGSFIHSAYISGYSLQISRFSATNVFWGIEMVDR